MVLTVTLGLIACSDSGTKPAATAQPGIEDAVKTAIDAYVYGYPLVTMDMTRKQFTNVAAVDAAHAPMGQIIKFRTYPAVDNHAVSAPNADTLYTSAFLDVSKEPWILSVPDMGDRYYLLPMLDGWTNVFQVPGKRTTGDKAAKYAITGPGWSGTLPAGVTEYKSPTGMVWILGRIYCTGTPADYASVHSLQDKFSLVPLSSYGKPYTPPAGQVDPNVDMKTAIRDQVDHLDVVAYFTYLAQLMKNNPPTAEDAPMVANMAKIGLVPGQDFDPSKLGAFDKEAIKVVPKLAQTKIMEQFKKTAPTNGWMFTHQDGHLRHGLSAAWVGHRYRTRRQSSAGRDLSHRRKGWERRRLRRFVEKVCHSLRQGPDAPSQWILVDHYVRRVVFLRAELPQSLHFEPAQ